MPAGAIKAKGSLEVRARQMAASRAVASSHGRQHHSSECLVDVADAADAPRPPSPPPFPPRSSQPRWHRWRASAMGWARVAAAAVAAAVVALSPPRAVGVAAAGGRPPGGRCPYTVTTEVAGRWTHTLLTVRTPAAIAAALAAPGVRRLGDFPPCARHRRGGAGIL